MEQITRAIIIAAGEGRRLRPVTLTTPKPLVKVNGTSFADNIIQALKKNGIHEIYIVTGYKKEQFIEAYRDDPDITILENPIYQSSNNISSIYAARDYLPGSFIIEGDLLINNPAIFDPEIEGSGYIATYMEEAPEWAITVEDGRIRHCEIAGGEDCYRLWGVSMWSRESGEKLAGFVKRQVEEIKDLSIYWDQIALSLEAESFELGIRETSLEDIIEVDTFDDLVSIDASYKDYPMNQKDGGSI